MRATTGLAFTIICAATLSAAAASPERITPGVILIAISYVQHFCPELTVDTDNTVQTLANLGFSKGTGSPEGMKASFADADAAAKYMAAKNPNHVEIGCGRWFAGIGPDGELAHGLIKFRR